MIVELLKQKPFSMILQMTYSEPELTLLPVASFIFMEYVSWLFFIILLSDYIILELFYYAISCLFQKNAGRT